MWNVITKRWQFKLLILGLAVLSIFVDQQKEGADWAQKITIALIFTSVVFLAEQVYEIHQYIHETYGALIKHADAGNDKLARRIMELESRIKIAKSEAEIAEAIKTHQGPIGQSLRLLDEALTNTLTITKTGFTVRNHSFAIRSYLDFWRCLVAEQRRRQSTSEPPLEARVIHSCSIKIWKDNNCEDLMLEQKDFTSAGGKISRILCSHDDKPNEDYCKVAARMTAANIKVAYYKIKNGERGHNFAWDFLVVADLNRAVIWKSDANSEIEEAIYTDDPTYNGEKLASTWERIDSRTHEVDWDFKI